MEYLSYNWKGDEVPKHIVLGIHRVLSTEDYENNNGDANEERGNRTKSQLPRLPFPRRSERHNVIVDILGTGHDFV